MLLPRRLPLSPSFALFVRHLIDEKYTISNKFSQRGLICYRFFISSGACMLAVGRPPPSLASLPPRPSHLVYGLRSRGRGRAVASWGVPSGSLLVPPGARPPSLQMAL